MIPGSANPLLLATAAGAGGYEIERSLRFNSSDSAYLSRTPASAGNRKTWTWAGWVKRSGLGTRQFIFSAQVNATLFNTDDLQFTSGNALAFWNTGNTEGTIVTSQVFRDVSAWYHIVFAYDSTQATASNRMKLYVNGVQVTTFSTSTYPALNRDSAFNSTRLHQIARRSDNSEDASFNGYLADIHFIDGQALDPSSFGEFDDNGVWQPIDYAGTFGTNGFRLDFSDNSAATATTLGKDRAGSNNWTPNNLSVTTGAGNDSLVDTPTSYGTGNSGGDVRGNYCTLNPLSTTAGTFTQGNLRYTGPSNWYRTNSTVSVSTGKWYWEVTLAGNPNSQANNGHWHAFGFGLSTVYASTTNPSSVTDAVVMGDSGWYKNFSAAWTNASGTFTSGSVLSVAVDLDANTFEFRHNNTSLATGTIGGTAGRELTPVIISYDPNYGVMDCNFGARSFAYSPPSGFKALCDTNLPAPVVAKPNEVMDVVLYTGNGSTAQRTISGYNFSPDLVWVKDRSAGNWHQLRSTLQSGVMYSNDTGQEGTNYANGFVEAITSSGFQLSTASNPIPVLNTNGNAYVAWAWDAGSSTVTNTQGSITSQVRANASAGFSVVTYTTPGSLPGTIGHGLGVEPYMVITKSRGAAGGWGVYHKSIGNANLLLLNGTNASFSGPNQWNGTTPTSTVFSIGTDYATSATYVAYCFAPVAGYSSFGSYIGNGSADGPFVYTGFRPRWIMIKNTGDGYDGGSLPVSHSWVIVDAARYGYNVVMPFLGANKSDAEYASNIRLDILSNGFKIRTNTGTDINGGQVHIYAAFAEHPFAYSRAR